ncbi:MAG: hypothetical protein ACSHXL_07865, partial [Bacteroidota bacterium]
MLKVCPRVKKKLGKVSFTHCWHAVYVVLWLSIAYSNFIIKIGWHVQRYWLARGFILSCWHAVYVVLWLSIAY